MAKQRVGLDAAANGNDGGAAVERGEDSMSEEQTKVCKEGVT